jgi:uncharacterized protein
MSSFRWRRLDVPGTDRATLTTTDTGYLLLGHAQFQDANGEADLHYSVQISPTWRTERAHLEGMGPSGPLAFEIVVNPGGSWTLNGTPFPSLQGCIDVDLNFTPATNMLSIRRLALPPGEGAEVVAAWLEFPEPRLEPLRQLYHHLGDGRYNYHCPEIPFAAVIQSNAEGFVTSYPPLWGAE